MLHIIWNTVSNNGLRVLTGIRIQRQTTKIVYSLRHHSYTDHLQPLCKLEDYVNNVTT